MHDHRDMAIGTPGEPPTTTSVRSMGIQSRRRRAKGGPRQRPVASTDAIIWSKKGRPAVQSLSGADDPVRPDPRLTPDALQQNCLVET
jgi:hypothetical protein